MQKSSLDILLDTQPIKSIICGDWSTTDLLRQWIFLRVERLTSCVMEPPLRSFQAVTRSSLVLPKSTNTVSLPFTVQYLQCTYLENIG